MKLERVEIENYRAIEKLKLRLDPSLTVLHGENGDGKTSVLSAIATGLGGIARWLPGVSGIDFHNTDLRRPRPLRVALKAMDGTEWVRRRRDPGPRRAVAKRRLKDAIKAIVATDRNGGDPIDLPIVAFYDTDRSVVDAPRRRSKKKTPQRRSKNKTTSFPRYAALKEAFSPKTDFMEFFNWFQAHEDEELRERKERYDHDFRLTKLETVRRAINALVPEISDPRSESGSKRFAVSMKREWGEVEDLALDQLSGGYRIMLALAADLARRMVQGNPHLDDPLQSEAIVLIDEVDLHLHPRWQQRVLTDLTGAFPNAQFIVSTHSPPVLTTVRPEHVVRLYRHNGTIHAGREVGPTYGAEAGGVLDAVMGVRERPERPDSNDENEFVKKLRKYMDYIDNGLGRTDRAVSLRKELDEISPRDSGLDVADMEMERQEIFAELGKES